MRLLTSLISLVLLSTAAVPAFADDQQDVRAADARYWQAFNTCDLRAMEELFTDDVEFYHDKTGLTSSKTAVIESLRKGPCNSPSLHLRREAIPDTVRFHQLAGGFALLSGTHRFYVRKGDVPESVDGQAEFTNLWQSVDGHWRMHRVISYAHGPVPYSPPTSHLSLSAEALAAFTGRYRGSKVGDITVVAIDDGLTLTAGTWTATLRAETPTRFFALERDLRFDFESGEGGRARTTRLMVLERGAVVETASRVE